ncbi:hypothetical protein [Paenibacillus sp. NFR01]|uniref:hypothetical protein n=1 Tax=Paenibacillus sp. NFR01 TaxID=1566279 RepID=UPI0015870FDC|nr:hypothetical protein [Paenibacillus sp. NFR01]
MKWEVFECEDCGRQYALKQSPDDEITEPTCPECGSPYNKPIDDIQLEEVHP